MQNRNLTGIRGGRWQRFVRYMRANWVFYLLILPAFLDVLIFRYIPIYGVQIAFRNFKIRQGILGSSWVGLKYFTRFIQSPNFGQLMRNTLLLSFYNLVFTFPLPILLAFMINEIRFPRLKKVTQMITYTLTGLVFWKANSAIQPLSDCSITQLMQRSSYW